MPNVRRRSSWILNSEILTTTSAPILSRRANYDEAIPWLERALQSRRYESYHYPHYNLGRAYMAKEMFVKARYHFEQALKLSSDYTLAKEALEKLRRKVQ